jgi:hypothetical protein
MTNRTRRTVVFALVFWLALLAFVGWDARRVLHDRFAEPPPWAIGQAPGETGAHCSAAPAPR